MKDSFQKGTVYSTDTGRICPECTLQINDCHCREKQDEIKGDGIIRVNLERKGRKGKDVTVISGIPLAGDDLKSLAKRLKQICSTGGTVKDGKIEIQGDKREVLINELKKRQEWTVR